MISWFVGMSGLLLTLSAAERLHPRLDAATNNPRFGQARPIGGVQLDLEPRRAQVFVDGGTRARSTTSEGTIATWLSGRPALVESLRRATADDL